MIAVLFYEIKGKFCESTMRIYASIVRDQPLNYNHLLNSNVKLAKL